MSMPCAVYKWAVACSRMRLAVVAALAVALGSLAGGGASGADSAGEPLIAFTDARVDFDLVVRNADGTDVRRILTGLGSDLDPSFSPDGEWIAFEHTSAGSSADIHVVRRDGSQRRVLAAGPGIEIDPAWSPDGTRIAWSLVEGGRAVIRVASAGGGSERTLTGGSADIVAPADVQPSWSPDSRRLAFARRGVIYEVAADGSTLPRQLVSAAFGLQGRPSWSPDGRSIATASWSSSINDPERISVAPVQADGQGRPRVVHVGTEPGWSPSGELYFLCADQLWRAGADGADPRPIQPLPTNRSLRDEPPGGWSYAAGRFAVGLSVGSVSQIYAVRPDGRGLRRLSERQARAPAFSPNGRRVAFIERSGAKERLVVTDLATGGIRVLAVVPFRLVDSIGWAPDGRRLVYAGSRGLYVSGLRGPGRRVPGTSRLDTEPAWSPNGKTIAFTRRQRGNRSDIRSLDLRSRRVRLLRRNAFSPAWSRDGRRLAYVNAWLPPYNHDIWVMRSNGSKTKRLTRNEAVDLNPVWSPDGRRIAFVSDRGTDIGPTFQVLVLQLGQSERRATVAAEIWGNQGPILSWRRR